MNKRYWLGVGFALACCCALYLFVGNPEILILPQIGLLKTRVFARDIGKFITIEVVNDYSGPIEAANVTMLEDGADPVMTVKWHVEGKEHVSAALAAIREEKLPDLMNVLDNYTGTLPLMRFEGQLANPIMDTL